MIKFAITVEAQPSDSRLAVFDLHILTASPVCPNWFDQKRLLARSH